MMSLHFYEIYYSWVLIIGWIIIPTIIGIGFFIFFARITNAYKKHKDFISDRKKKIEWGYRWDGTPYIKNQGWGNNHSKLDEDEYFIRLNARRKEKEEEEEKAEKAK